MGFLFFVGFGLGIVVGVGLGVTLTVFMPSIGRDTGPQQGEVLIEK